MTRTLIAALAAASLFLAACGEDDSGNNSTAAASGNAPSREDAQLAFARCMRENGVDMPDPETDGDGRVIMRGPGPGSGGSPEKFQAAEAKCRKHLEGIKPPNRSEEQKKEMADAALENARCMRAQGINFPDPQVSEDGNVQVQIGPGSGIDFDSPRFRKAQEACKDTMPKPMRANP